MRDVWQMRTISVLIFALALIACSQSAPEAKRIAEVQAKSFIGPTEGWPLGPSLSLKQVQGMRYRAYSYCFDKKPTNETCFGQQDESLFGYANSFRLVRIFRSEPDPTFAYAVAHKNDPAAFERVRTYCYSVYDDQGSRDARSLGPCMAAGLGADYFHILAVP